MAQFSVYAHLTPTTHPELICETVKFTLNPGNSDLGQDEEEFKAGSDSGDCINDLVS